MTMSSRPNLIREPQECSPEAIGLLYDEYGRGLFALAYRLMGTREDAEDVVHDVFVGLPAALTRYDERGALPAWLRRITVRVALMRQRSRERRHETGLDDAADFPTPCRMSADQLEVRTAIAELPPALRNVLVLKEIEGYSHAEIAQQLGITAVTSRVRLMRALTRLRKRLGDIE